MAAESSVFPEGADQIRSYQAVASSREVLHPIQGISYRSMMFCCELMFTMLALCHGPCRGP